LILNSCAIRAAHSAFVSVYLLEVLSKNLSPIATNFNPFWNKFAATLL
jgi:hypothetical protein